MTLAESQEVIYIRISKTDKAALRQCVKDRGSNISVFGREVICRALAELSYLTSDRKKALGVNGEAKKESA